MSNPISNADIMQVLNEMSDRLDDVLGVADPPQTPEAWLNSLVTPCDTVDPGDCQPGDVCCKAETTSFEQCGPCERIGYKAGCSNCPGSNPCPTGLCNGSTDLCPKCGYSDFQMMVHEGASVALTALQEIAGDQDLLPSVRADAADLLLGFHIHSFPEVG